MKESKEIIATGTRIWDDCILQQVQCKCGEIFEAWTKESVKAKFDEHKCKNETHE